MGSVHRKISASLGVWKKSFDIGVADRETKTPSHLLQNADRLLRLTTNLSLV